MRRSLNTIPPFNVDNSVESLNSIAPSLPRYTPTVSVSPPPAKSRIWLLLLSSKSPESPKSSRSKLIGTSSTPKFVLLATSPRGSSMARVCATSSYVTTSPRPRMSTSLPARSCTVVKVGWLFASSSLATPVASSASSRSSNSRVSENRSANWSTSSSAGPTNGISAAPKSRRKSSSQLEIWPSRLTNVPASMLVKSGSCSRFGGSWTSIVPGSVRSGQSRVSVVAGPGSMPRNGILSGRAMLADPLKLALGLPSASSNSAKLIRPSLATVPGSFSVTLKVGLAVALPSTISIDRKPNRALASRSSTLRFSVAVAEGSLMNSQRVGSAGVASRSSKSMPTAKWRSRLASIEASVETDRSASPSSRSKPRSSVSLAKILSVKLKSQVSSLVVLL